MVRSLAQIGCRVSVLTGKPNYPDGRVFEGYRAGNVAVEAFGKHCTIHRVPIVPRGPATGGRLVANYLSFILSASLLGPWLLRHEKFDAIFVYAPSPILQAIPAIVLKTIKRIPLVTWVQDLWPQSLESTGFIRNRYALRIVEWMVRWIYSQNDLLLGQSRAFVTEIQRFAGRTPVEYFPNPGDVTVGDETEESKPVLVLEPGFNVVFAGNLGTVQALDTVLAAAELLRPDRDVRFTVIGSGSRGEWLKREVERRDLKNVSVKARVPLEAMPGIMEQASALLVTLVRSPIMSQTIPSKVQSYLAAGRPIIAALDGEGANVVLESGAGVAVPAEDPGALADSVRGLKALSGADRALMGAAGRRFYMKNFDPEVLSRQLAARLGDTAALSRQSPRGMRRA